MKTAEEWYRKYQSLSLNNQQGKEYLFRQIQLDAIKQGMTDAAKIGYQSGCTTRDKALKAILTARDERKEV